MFRGLRVPPRFGEEKRERERKMQRRYKRKILARRAALQRRMAAAARAFSSRSRGAGGGASPVACLGRQTCASRIDPMKLTVRFRVSIRDVSRVQTMKHVSCGFPEHVRSSKSPRPVETTLERDAARRGAGQRHAAQRQPRLHLRKKIQRYKDTKIYNDIQQIGTGNAKVIQTPK